MMLERCFYVKLLGKEAILTIATTFHQYFDDEKC